MLDALNVRARSSDSPATLLILIPGAGAYSYMVMTGPGRISTTSPSTPKSESFFSSLRAFISRLSLWILVFFLSGGSERRSSGGSLSSPDAFMKGNFSCRGIFSSSDTGSTMVTLGLALIILRATIVFFALFLRSVLFITSVMSPFKIPSIQIPSLEKSHPRESLVRIIKEMMKIAKSMMSAPNLFRAFLAAAAICRPISPPASIPLPLKKSSLEKCRSMMAEKETTMKTAAIRLFMGDKTDRPWKERKESAKKTMGIQKAAKPRESKETPARCAPIAPKRLCALPRGPVVFQSNLSVA